MKTWQSIVVGIITGFLLAGLVFLVALRPAQKALQLIPPTPISSITVDIDGQVGKPGILQLPENSRVNDAVQAAQGLLPNADTSQVNLAAYLRDGDKVYIPAIIGDPSSTSTTNQLQLIDLNHATLDEIDSLPGIGPQKAQQIIAYRDTYGPFTQLEDLLFVSGIGQSILDQIRDKVIFTR